MRKWKWVSRDIDGASLVDIWSSVGKPQCRNGEYLQRSGRSAIYADDFDQMFGICPKPGECLKVEFQGAKILPK